MHLALLIIAWSGAVAAVLAVMTMILYILGAILDA